MSSTAPNHRRGFTLIEALVGTAVFTIGILGSLGLVGWIAQATAATGRITAAEAVAQARMEQILQAGHDTAVSGTAVDGDYTLAWTVIPAAGRKEVALAVDWTDTRGHPKSVTLGAMLADQTVAAVLPAFAMPGHGGGGIPPDPDDPDDDDDNNDDGDDGGDDDDGDEDGNGNGNGKGKD